MIIGKKDKERFCYLEKDRTALKDLVIFLEAIANGCSKHPGYRGIRAPSACETCVGIARSRQWINNNEYAKQMGVVLNTGKRGKTKIKES